MIGIVLCLLLAICAVGSVVALVVLGAAIQKESEVATFWALVWGFLFCCGVLFSSYSIGEMHGRAVEEPAAVEAEASP